MPKGRTLTPVEREEIARMHEAGASGREIAKKLARSKTVVLNFLKNPAQYGQIKRSGRKRALSSEDERRLYLALFQPRTSSSTQGSLGRTTVELQSQGAAQEEREQAPGASSGDDELGAAASEIEEERLYSAGHQDVKKSAEQIKKEFNVPLSVRRIQQLLSDWRRDARRAQDRQHQVQQVNSTPTPAHPAVDQNGGDSSGAIGGVVVQKNNNESGGASTANNTMEPTAAAQPIIDGRGESGEMPANPVEAPTEEDVTSSIQETQVLAEPVVDATESTIGVPSYLEEAARQAMGDASSEPQETSAAVATESAEVVMVDTSSDMSIIQV